MKSIPSKPIGQLLAVPPGALAIMYAFMPFLLGDELDYWHLGIWLPAAYFTFVAVKLWKGLDIASLRHLLAFWVFLAGGAIFFIILLLSGFLDGDADNMSTAEHIQVSIMVLVTLCICLWIYRSAAAHFTSALFSTQEEKDVP